MRVLTAAAAAVALAGCGAPAIPVRRAGSSRWSTTSSSPTAATSARWSCRATRRFATPAATTCGRSRGTSPTSRTGRASASRRASRSGKVEGVAPPRAARSSLVPRSVCRRHRVARNLP